MENHPIYRDFKQLALQDHYSIEYVEGLGFNEAAELLGRGDFTQTFLNNMKRGVVAVLQDRDDEADLQGLRSQLIDGNRRWLQENFPDAQFERGRQADKPYITIWLRGKA